MLRWDSNGFRLHPLYDRLFETIHPPDEEEDLLRGERRATHDDVATFKYVLSIIEEEGLMEGLKSIKDEFRNTVFEKAVECECLKITKMLSEYGFGEPYLPSESMSYEMYDFLTSVGLYENHEFDDEPLLNHLGNYMIRKYPKRFV